MLKKRNTKVLVPLPLTELDAKATAENWVSQTPEFFKEHVTGKIYLPTSILEKYNMLDKINYRNLTFYQDLDNDFLYNYLDRLMVKL